MADSKLYIIDQNTGRLLPLKLIDPGDGSGYSLATSSSGGSGGDASAANQVTGNASLASIDAGIPVALGQTTKANSLAVVPASDWTLPRSDNLEVTGSVSSAINVINATDVAGYHGVVVQLTGTWSGSIIWEVSNDNTNFVAVTLQNVATNVITTSVTANGVYFAPIIARYFRARVSSYGSGTIVATAEFSPFSYANVNSISISAAASANMYAGIVAPADAQGASFGLAVVGQTQVFNGTTWDRHRNTNAAILLASAARTVTTNSADQINYNWRGMILIVNISSIGTGSITPSIQYKDSISGNYKTIWTAAAALIADGTYVYGIYPGELNTASMTEVVNALLTRTFRLAMVANNANSVTYSASADMQL